LIKEYAELLSHAQPLTYAELGSAYKYKKGFASCFPMLLKPSWSFFNKPVSLVPSAHTKKGPTPVVIPSYAEKGNGKHFPIQKKGQQLYEPSPSFLVL